MPYASPFPPVEDPNQNLYTYIFDNLTEEELQRDAIVEVTTDDKVTYAELKDRADAVAGELAARGIGPGDVVTIQIPNSINFAAVTLGVMRAGAVASPVGILMHQHDVEHAINIGKSKLYIGLTDMESIPQIWPAELPSVYKKGLPAPDIAVDPDSIAAMPFSSGTTGLPKGVELPHRALVMNCVQCDALFDHLGLEQADKVLSPLPFSHIYGLVVLLFFQLSRGSTIHTMPKFDLEQFILSHGKYQIEFTFIAPPMAVVLAKHPMVKPEDFKASKYMLSGSAPLGAELASAVEERLGTTLLQGFGMTEVVVTHLSIPGKTPPGSVGVSIPNCEFKIVDPANLDEVAQGDQGELWVKTPCMMRGYKDNKEATDETLVGDGWLRTGDAAVVDEDGNVTIVDRYKELIKYKGYQVSPVELESLLLGHPEIADVCVVGADRDGVEIPFALVIKAEGSELTEQDIMDWVARQVTPYKKVRGVEFVTELPKTAAGKNKRGDIRKMAAELV